MTVKDVKAQGHRPLSIAVVLFRQLEQANVRFGIFKSTASVPEGLAGIEDFDVLVARSDYSRFCEILTSLQAVRGVVHWTLASVGREDWLVPDFASGRYLHLDVHCDVRLGHKFNKAY